MLHDIDFNATAPAALCTQDIFCLLGCTMPDTITPKTRKIVLKRHTEALMSLFKENGKEIPKGDLQEDLLQFAYAYPVEGPNILIQQLTRLKENTLIHTDFNFQAEPVITHISRYGVQNIPNTRPIFTQARTLSQTTLHKGQDLLASFRSSLNKSVTKVKKTEEAQAKEQEILRAKNNGLFYSG